MMVVSNRGAEVRCARQRRARERPARLFLPLPLRTRRHRRHEHPEHARQMTNVSDVLEPRESRCWYLSPTPLTLSLAPPLRLSSKIFPPFFGTLACYRLHRYDVRTACPTWHRGGAILGRARWKHVRMRAEQATWAQTSAATTGDAQA
ncbi:hypothetical protein L227DRAFT_381277 [Lentinus tigrinus ALCF2SS1-6]|uniref:Uncharacterized protein n=1 Tax=Lentinus tigrinus ALCF2SS1-6 TaxID=1328759 RepID=A0A5C2RT26_9APHY|nr:hypothetical protein L227DRAFT_381277 [Lentinus tigrinus ALCF2SS1-6]